MLQSMASKIGVSIVTAVTGGAAWMIVEPGMRSQVARWTGLEDAPASEIAAEATTPTSAAAPAPLDLARDPNANPSFNCDDAATTVERLICSDPAIAEADRSLNRVWAALRQRGMISDTLKLSQRQWLARRDACLIDDDPKACVRNCMLERIETLSAL